MIEALSIELVLETLFKFLPYKDLKSCRQVNKNWNKVAAIEFRKRSAPIHLDHDLKNFKKFYELELITKNQEISAKLPMSAHIRVGGKSDWKILKDLATHAPWKPRVTTLMLSDFWAADLNRLLPFLLSNLPNLKVLILSAVNNRVWKSLDMDSDDFSRSVPKSVIPKDFIVPTVSKEVKYSVQSLTISWLGEEYRRFHPFLSMLLVLNPEVFAQCASLKEINIEVDKVANDVIEFFRRIEEMPSDCFTSVEHVSLRVELDEESDNSFRLQHPLSIFVNRIKPTSLDLTNCLYFDPLEFFLFLNKDYMQAKQSVHSLSLDIPVNEEGKYRTNRALVTIQMFEMFSHLEVLHLHANPRMSIFENHRDIFAPKNIKHDLASVTTLKLSCDLHVEVTDDDFKVILQDARPFLPNIQQVEILDYYTHKNLGRLEDEEPEKFAGFFEGLSEFPNLKKLSFHLVDFAGDLVRVGWGTKDSSNDLGNDGIFAGLSLLNALEEITVTVRLDYDLSLDNVLTVLFAGHEPSVKFNLDLTQKSAGHLKVQMSSEELKKALTSAKPDFFAILPDNLPLLHGLMKGMPRYLKMINYKPIFKP